MQGIFFFELIFLLKKTFMREMDPQFDRPFALKD